MEAEEKAYRYRQSATSACREACEADQADSAGAASETGRSRWARVLLETGQVESRPVRTGLGKLPVSVRNSDSLIDQMRTDFAAGDNASVREFLVLPSRHVVFNSGGRPYLFYYEDQHQDLVGKIAVLENNGFVTETTSTNVPKYRVTEQFVQFLRGQ